MDTESVAQAGEADVSLASQAWYLYGITLPESLEGLQDLNDTRLGGASTDIQILQCGDLALVVKSVLREDFTDEALARHIANPERLQSMVHDHNAVITVIHEQRPILPAKFGSVYADAGHLTAAIEGIQDELRARLERLEGTDEWAVHTYVDRSMIEQQTILRSSSLRDLEAEIAAARPGRAYFLQRKRADLFRVEVKRFCDVLAQDVFEQLRSRALAGEVGSSHGDLPSGDGDVEVLRAAFLVSRAQSDDFLALVDSLADNDVGLRIEATGPWPPYSFVESVEDALQ